MEEQHGSEQPYFVPFYNTILLNPTAGGGRLKNINFGVLEVWNILKQGPRKDMLVCNGLWWFVVVCGCLWRCVSACVFKHHLL